MKSCRIKGGQGLFQKGCILDHIWMIKCLQLSEQSHLPENTDRNAGFSEGNAHLLQCHHLTGIVAVSGLEHRSIGARTDHRQLFIVVHLQMENGEIE